ncbi:MAG: hypothetical protein FRX49_11041 [Trebouxia sp. A1-2]|nr:MAG: hypothetical protein FRX49_11041 [Trebouxia sp. A1-2]
MTSSRRQKPSTASDRTRAALSAVYIVLLCPGLAAAARPLEEQQQQHVAPAERRLQQVFSQASGTGGFVNTMTSGSFNGESSSNQNAAPGSASSTTILPNNTSPHPLPQPPPVNSSAGESHSSPTRPTSPAQAAADGHLPQLGRSSPPPPLPPPPPPPPPPCCRKLSQVFSEASGNAPGGTVSTKTSGTLNGQTSSSNETLPNAASNITILPPPHPPTNATAKVGSAWLLAFTP